MCGVGGGRWAPYVRYFSYPAKILEKGCPTWPDNRGCTAPVNVSVWKKIWLELNFISYWDLELHHIIMIWRN